MRILITGTPGVGKSTIAHKLGEKLKFMVISEKRFCEKRKIGKYNPAMGEREVPLSRLQKELSAFLKQNDQVIIEGHLSCECKLRPIDCVIVVRLNPERLEFRLRERQYNEVKIQDNVMVEGIGYCLKYAQKNYGKRVFEVSNDKELKETLSIIIKKLTQKGLSP